MRILLLIFAILLIASDSWAQNPSDDAPAEVTSEDLGRTRDITANIRSGRDTIFISQKMKETHRSKALALRAKAMAARPKAASNPPTGPKSWEDVGVIRWLRVNETPVPPLLERDACRLRQ